MYVQLAWLNEACTSVAAIVPHVFAVYMSIRRKPMKSASQTIPSTIYV